MSTAALAQQQSALRAAIVHGLDADQPGSSAASGLLRPREDAAPLLRIYQHAYTSRLAEALRDNFGVLPQIMGDEAFDALAQAYIRVHPSRHPSIRWFGHRLAEFMSQREDLVPHPAFVDLARMEWALRAAFDAADAEPLAAQALAGLAPADWPRLVLLPLPSLQLLELQWNVEPAWRAFKEFDPLVDAEPELEEPQPVAHGLLVWRQGLETRWRALEGLPLHLLHQALQGAAFAQLCDTAQRAQGEAQAVPAVVAELQGWLADGLFRGFRLRG